MTLPNERTRAVIAAQEFLTRLVSPYNKNGIKKIPKAVRDEALNILRHFPRPFDLHAAAQGAPDVFDAQTVMRHDEEQEQLAQQLEAVRAAQSDDYVMSEAEAAALAPDAPRNRPTVKPEKLPEPFEPDTSWMDANELFVDPPSGWRYGFPKVWDKAKHPDLTRWMIDNGYPKKLARQNLPVRFMSVSE
jgi:hypothetical protein